MPNPKYKPNKKNKGKPPEATDERVKLVPIACGKCMKCQKNKAREWQIRLTEELKERNGLFITLTFTEKDLIKLENIALGINPALEGYRLDTATAHLAFNRFRLRYLKEIGHRPRGYFITELGHENTERLHFHGILFDNIGKEELGKIWKYGRVDIGEYCNERSIGYVTKYLYKKDERHSEYETPYWTSPGLGAGWLKSKSAELQKKQGIKGDYYRFRDGVKTSMPIYYRNKLYSDEEREELWIEKLNKEETWVDGHRYDLSTEEGYTSWNLGLKEGAKWSETLGFRPHIDYERKRWEEEKRKLIKKIRHDR